MDRVIRVGGCGMCPHRDHKGAYGQVAYVPVCRATNRELPYALVQGYGDKAQARGTNEIPDWCPLEKLGS